MNNINKKMLKVGSYNKNKNFHTFIDNNLLNSESDQQSVVNVR